MKEFKMQYWTRGRAHGQMYAQAVEAVLKAQELGATKIVLEVIYTEAKEFKGSAKHFIDEKSIREL